MLTSSPYMQEALKLARQGWYTTRPNPAVGCVFVQQNSIIARGCHQYPGGPHAEQVALAQLTAEQASGAACYVTLEPCAHYGRTPPCIDALIKAGIRSLHVATTDPNQLTAGKSIALARSKGIHVEVGVLASEAIDINPGFFSHHIRKRPWVRAKMAMTLDGRTAKADGTSQWITGAFARRRVQHWRAMSGAIMTGIGTILADDPQLNVREKSIISQPCFQQPIKIVLDRQKRLSSTAKVLQQRQVVHVHQFGEVERNIPNTESIMLPAEENWSGIWQACYERNIQSVLVEAGATLLGRMLDLGLVDELILHIAPKLLGPNARPLANLEKALPLNEPGVYSLVESLPLGDDIELRYQNQESQKCLMV